MARLLITNGLGETKIISRASLEKQEEDYKQFKETILCDISMPDSLRQRLTALWTIPKIEEIE